MSSIVFTGKIPKNLSKEEVRSVFHATETVLRYHNLEPANETITVHFTTKDLGYCRKAKKKKAVGDAQYKTSYVNLQTPWLEKKALPYNSFVTVAIHEMIHVFMDFDDCECEKLTSTLTKKLKPDIVRLANILVENTYKRAAYIAHTKIAYKPMSNDHYDDSQYKNNHEGTRGKKYRHKRNGCNIEEA